MDSTDNKTSSDSIFVRPAPSTMIAWNSLQKVDVALWIKILLLAILFGTLIPLAIAARSRTDVAKKDPRIHIIQDMDNQPKFKAQQSSAFFADGRSNRPPVPGTVSQDQLGQFTDSAYYEGFTVNNGATTWVDGYPAQIQAIFNDSAKAEAFVKRGQYVYNYTCINCHGADGSGQGAIHKRAVTVGALGMGWVQPASLIGADFAKKARSNGHIYATINRGIANMGPLGHVIDNPADRWAVVAYVRALQAAHASPTGTAVSSAK
ncbi:MAG: cytochrome c [Tepidisphaeraceae bacterium]